MMRRDVETMHVPRVIIGSGIAGLTTALTAGDSMIVTRGTFGSGSSRWAQGGIAACKGSGDSPADHAEDTLDVSGGIADPRVASIVTHAAAGRIDWLTQLGAMFDRDDAGNLKLGREAGHSARRIVHANGDATGAEVMCALVTAVRKRADLSVYEHMVAVDLILRGDHVGGVLCLDEHGNRVAVLAEQVVLASGGIGGLYAHTTNPPEVRGDGLAMALRAGVRVADLEFVQFHPTTLDIGRDPSPLLTEALRGEGAKLIDDRGERIMQGVHKDLELAPRDVVARAIWRSQRGGRRVFLDATHIGEDFAARFPTVWESASSAGFDPRVDRLPVTPAAHYHMGGIATDTTGRTSLDGLWAVGEVACTGLHGANRLASNSLLEGLVIGARVGRDLQRRAREPKAAGLLTVPADSLCVLDEGDAERSAAVRSIMWNHVGIDREAGGLRHAIDSLQEIGRRAGNDLVPRNLTAAAVAIAQCALDREESRGSHYRSDYSTANDRFAHRTLVQPSRVAHVGLKGACAVSAA